MRMTIMMMVSTTTIKSELGLAGLVSVYCHWV